MAEKDALSNFDFGKFSGGGLFLKWTAGVPVTLRVLTVDPMVTTKEFTAPDGEVNLSTQFHFIVYNFTEGKAQVLSASPSIARRIGELHKDNDFGANIRNIDLKITPTGEKLSRKYDIQVLPKANQLTNEQIQEATKIKLDDVIKDGSRMSMYDAENHIATSKVTMAPETPEEDTVIEDIGDEPINLDDIPF
jgi:hypothetical protein